MTQFHPKKLDTQNGREMRQFINEVLYKVIK